MAVVTIFPCQVTSRGSPTLTETSFIWRWSFRSALRKERVYRRVELDAGSGRKMRAAGKSVQPGMGKAGRKQKRLTRFVAAGAAKVAREGREENAPPQGHDQGGRRQ